MSVKRSNLSINTIMAYCEALLVIAKSCSLLPHYRPISISTLQSQNDCKYNQTYSNCRVQFCASVNHQIASISEAYNKLTVVDEKVARYCHTICTVVKPSFLVLYNSSVSAVKWFAITDISLCCCFTIACNSMFDCKILSMTSDIVSSFSGIFLQLEHVHRPTGGEISKQSSWCHFWHRWHWHICPHAANWCMHSGMQVIVSMLELLFFCFAFIFKFA